jgi:hypothetical protein
MAASEKAFAAVDASRADGNATASAGLVFKKRGLLLSLSVVILDQYIPGEWF